MFFKNKMVHPQLSGVILRLLPNKLLNETIFGDIKIFCNRLINYNLLP